MLFFLIILVLLHNSSTLHASFMVFLLNFYSYTIIFEERSVRVDQMPWQEALGSI